MKGREGHVYEEESLWIGLPSSVHTYLVVRDDGDMSLAIDVNTGKLREFHNSVLDDPGFLVSRRRIA